MNFNTSLKGKAGIYVIYQLVDNKLRLYIGSSNNLYLRKNEHFRKLRLKKHFNAFLQNAYNKYGEESFHFDVLQYIEDIDKLLEREQFLVSLYLENGFTLFNIAKDILRPQHGYIRSQVTRNKLSKAQLEFNKTEKGKERALNCKKAHKEKLSMPTPEFIHIETKEIIPSYPSRRDLSRDKGLEIKGICRLIKGQLIHYRGYMLKTKYDESPVDVIPKKRNPVFTEDQIKVASDRLKENRVKPDKICPAFYNIKTKQIIQEQPHRRAMEQFVNLSPKTIRKIINGELQKSKG